MKFEKDQEMIGVVATSLIEKKEGVCLTDEEFALYIEGRLNKEKRRAVISHFVSCGECRERLTIPIRPLEVAKEANTMEKFLAFFWRPLIAAPVAVVFVVLVAFSLNIYLKSQNVPEQGYEERYRGANLVSLKQLDLTPSLLKIIKEGNEERLKNEFIKGLPSGVNVSHVVVEDKLKYLEETKEGDKINLILYSNGLLKVKLEK